jgi:hypothetical protein
MKITQKELEQELNSLEAFGLTQEELEGYVKFYKDTLEVELIKKRKVQVLNSGCRKNKIGENYDDI